MAATPAKADYVGVVSGHKTDKSGVFAFEPGETGAPLIAEAPVVMECRVDDVYETKGFESFAARSWPCMPTSPC